MNTGESRVPQDGRLTVSFDGRTFDVRTSTIPVGASKRPCCAFSNASTSFRTSSSSAWGPSCSRAINAASVGRGRSASSPGRRDRASRPRRYASLQTISLETSNVCSVEDPIECRIPGISQIAVNERAGITFPLALRALLRQNPHQLFIGELRDADTVAIALQASLTGISLVTTLHARDALARRGAPRRARREPRDRSPRSMTLAVSQRLDPHALPAL